MKSILKNLSLVAVLAAGVGLAMAAPAAMAAYHGPPIATANLGYTATGTLDFPSMVTENGSELTIAVTGAATNASVILGPPTTIESGLCWNGWVSAPNVVTVRVDNFSTGTINPASATWRATVLK